MEDRSSRTSIIVALVAIVLIVGGIFLLNQSISGQNTTEDNNDEEIVVVTPQTEPNPTTFEECQTKGGFIIQGPPQECTYNGKAFVKETTDTSTDTDDSDTPDNTNTNTDTDTDANTTPEPTITQLATDEFTAKVVSLDGANSKYTIVESGFTNPKWIKPGANMNLVGITQSSFGVTLEVGKTYKFKANITESASGFQINSIDKVTQIN